MTDHSRKVLRVQGDDPRGFLQGLVTNDVALLDRGMVYSALLTPQGKLIADFFLVPSGNDILIDVHANWADAVLSRLTMYKLRTKIELTLTEIPVTRGVNAQPDSAFADPRHPSLGWRDYTGAPEEQGIDWDALHVAATVPQSCVELTPDTFILEAGFERLNGVDFRKGCYVGQEVTARMKPQD